MEVGEFMSTLTRSVMAAMAAGSYYRQSSVNPCAGRDYTRLHTIRC